MLISERSETFAANGYRYGFNGKEQDNEVSGEGNSYDFGARIYDSRLGRWMSVDALWRLYPSHSPFNFAINSPISVIDIDGNIIGNPRNAFTKEQKRIYKSTNAGKKLWRKMVWSPKVISFHNVDDYNMGSDPKAPNWRFQENWEASGDSYHAGRSMSNKEFKLLFSSNYDSNIEDMKFDSKTGKSKNIKRFWIKTHIVISKRAIEMAVFEYNDEIMFKAEDLYDEQYAEVMGITLEETEENKQDFIKNNSLNEELEYRKTSLEEGYHTASQNRYDLYKPTFNEETGKYESTGEVIPYEKREAEIEAKEFAHEEAIKSMSK